MPYHVVISTAKAPSFEIKWDLTEPELEDLILAPYRDSRPIVVNGRTILPEQIERVQVVKTELPSSNFTVPTVKHLAARGDTDWYQLEPGALDASDVFITSPCLPVAEATEPLEILETVCSRFHAIARQLRQRHDDCPTIDVRDEYDVQDLMHGLLRAFFEDIRPEEWTPSYFPAQNRAQK